MNYNSFVPVVARLIGWYLCGCVLYYEFPFLRGLLSDHHLKLIPPEGFSMLLAASDFIVLNLGIAICGLFGYAIFDALVTWRLRSRPVLSTAYNAALIFLLILVAWWGIFTMFENYMLIVAQICGKIPL